MFYSSSEIKHSFIGSPGGLIEYNLLVARNSHSADKLAFQKRADQAFILSCCYVSISWLVLLLFYVKPYAERIQVINILLHLIQSKGFKSTF